MRTRSELQPEIGAGHAVAGAAWHSLAWLVFANAIGVLLAVLLLFPTLNTQLGEWTYGRWMMVHMNLELYGWASLPLVGFLFRVYDADRGATANWTRPVLWVWSAALGVGAVSWLSGNSSGKLFLDWSGYARIIFPLALLTLWLFLAFAFAGQLRDGQPKRAIGLAARLSGLALLLAVPIVLYAASSPGSYPPVNPATGGPTGASQLESSLAIVAIVLMLPFGLTVRKLEKSNTVALAWLVLIGEILLCIGLGRGDTSHHQPAQFLSLASLLVWLPITPAYYSAFQWHRESRRWRRAFLWWWSALLVTGWLFFLPGVLDHFKFTDGLVGHSFVAMAGFASSLLIFAMVQLLGEGGWIFNGNRSFVLWHVGVIAYVLLMTVAGWFEAFDAAFIIVPGVVRNVIYALRLITGILMLTASVAWLRDASQLLREPVRIPVDVAQGKIA